MSRLMLQPISLREANSYIAKWHRHHGGVAGHKFSIACVKDGAIADDGALTDNTFAGISLSDGDIAGSALVDSTLAGVVIAGRPVSRRQDDGYTLEITRLCTDGTENACSFLYGAAVRAARAMGYRRVITYTLETENGTSLKAAGFTFDGITAGGSWDSPSRRRTDKSPTAPKKRWVKTFS